ncbi:hypothetical protein LPJ75_004382 [Coemansia sp. RSA 2598]|nr:hypothetical protein LPJ75_004382 [Coemansia sp. RSA 2598]
MRDHSHLKDLRARDRQTAPPSLSSPLPPQHHPHLLGDDVQDMSACNPWAAGSAPAAERPWSRAVHCAVRRIRVQNDPLLSPSATDIDLFARKVARDAESGLLQSLGDAISSPLPRSKTHMVGVKADSDVEALSVPASHDDSIDVSPLLLASRLPTEPEDPGQTSSCASICGLAIRVNDSDHTARSSTTPNLAIPARVGADVVIMSRSHNGIAISEADGSPASSVAVGGPSSPRTIKMIRHLISPTDTLEGISVQYGVAVSQIKRLNRIWHPSEISIRDHLYIPLRLCSSKYTVAYIEHVNRQHLVDARNGVLPSSPFIDLIEVVLDSTPCASPSQLQQSVSRRPRWPLVPYESIQSHFSFAL